MKTNPFFSKAALRSSRPAWLGLLGALILAGAGQAPAEPSLILTPQPGWNGWSAETRVRAGFRQHGGAAEVVTQDTANLSINPSATADSVVAARTVGASRLPTSGSAKDKAEGSLGFAYLVGNAGTQDRFSFTLNSTTSAMTAKQDFGAGPVPADSFFEAEIILRTFAPIGAGVNFTLPDMPALSHPATETMTAQFSGWSAAGGAPSPLAGYLLPGDAGFTIPLTLTGVQEFSYRMNYSIVTPYGEDPTVTYTLTGGAAGQAPANVVPNPDFEITGLTNPTDGNPNGSMADSAAAKWFLRQDRSTFLHSAVIPSTDILSGSSGNMASLRTEGIIPADSLGNRFFVVLGEELPAGSTGTMNIKLVSGAARAGFLNERKGDIMLPGQVSALNTPGWQQLHFSNPTEASQKIGIQLDGPGVTEVHIDHVTARPPTALRFPRYDYPGAFGPVSKWISGFAYPNQVPLTGDFDGDGLDDIVTFLRSAYPGQIGYVYVALNTGSGAFNFPGAGPGLWQSSFCIGSETPGVGDFDGDGRDDIITFIPNGNVFVALSTGSRFATSRAWYPEGNVFQQLGDVPLVGDVNGDGRDDIIAIAGDDVFVALNTGTGFALATRWQSDFRRGAGVPRVGDVNGDGSADLVLFVRNSNASRAGDVEVALSFAGNEFRYESSRSWHSNFAPDTDHEPLLADLNGDGSLDLVAVHNDGRVFAAIKTDASSFASGAGAVSNDPAWQWHADIRNPGEKPLVGHFNRDMNDDLCTFVFDLRAGADFAATFVTLCGNPAQPRLTGIAQPGIARTRDFLAVTAAGFIPTGWEARARLLGPGGTFLTPVLTSSAESGATWQIPGGDYPSGLYRFLVFDDISLKPTSNAWPVRLINPLDDWRAIHWTTTERSLPALSGDRADPDGDGLPNLGEYLLGRDPTEFTVNPIPWIRLNNGAIFHQFNVRRDRTGSIQCQYGVTPATWNNGTILEFSGNSISSGYTVENLVTPPNAGGRFFSRLKFDQIFTPK